MSILIQAAGFGLVTAALLSLGAVGFTLQYGVTNVFNLAIAGVMSGSAYVALQVNHSGVNIWWSMAVAAVFGGTVSYALNRFVYVPFIERGVKAFSMVIIALAVWTIMQYITLAVVGSGFFGYNLPRTRTYQFGSVSLTGTDLILVAIAITGMAGLEAALRLTKFGTAMRAVSTNAPLARASGIRVDRIIDATWAISGIFSGIAGVAIAMVVVSFSYTTIGDFLVPTIAAAVVGGVGSPSGAMIGAFIVGLFSEVGAAVTQPDYKNVIAFALLAVVLLIRPAGLIPEKAQRKELAL
jgi:branched-subunit amino acid ABC-type transport system permease component